MAARKTEYTNQTQGYLGVVKINRKGDAEGLPVPPGERVFLTTEEVNLTEQSHAHREDSPFAIREIVHFDPATGDEIARFKGAPLSKGEPATRQKAAAAA